MAHFHRFVGPSFSSGRAPARRYTHSGYDNQDIGCSSRLNGPLDMPYGDFRTTSHREEPDKLALRRAASEPKPHNSRYKHGDLSPIRSSERPRPFTNKQAYNDHRCVSPLGTSRFEKPYMSSRQISTAIMGRTLSNRTPYYATNSRDTSRSTSGNGVFYNSAVRGGDASRILTPAQVYGTRLDRERQPNTDLNFRESEFNRAYF